MGDLSCSKPIDGFIVFTWDHYVDIAYLGKCRYYSTYSEVLVYLVFNLKSPVVVLEYFANGIGHTSSAASLDLIYNAIIHYTYLPI